MTKKREGRNGRERTNARKNRPDGCPTILVVINDLKFNEFLVDALKIIFSCEVLSVTTGRSALEAVKSVKPDLVIIDYQLFDLNALELSDRLHGLKELASVLTIITNIHMTSWSERQRGHIIYLRTPFQLKDLYAAVKKALSATDDCVEGMLATQTM